MYMQILDIVQQYAGVLHLDQPGTRKAVTWLEEWVIVPVVKIPKLHSVTAMPALAPSEVADASNASMIGLIAKVAAQLNKLSLCDSNDRRWDLSSRFSVGQPKKQNKAHHWYHQ
jgi:hypothetical protein